MKQIITHLILLFSITTNAQDISGKWSGIIQSGKSEPVIFNFTFENRGEVYSAILDIPALRVANLKPKETAFSKEELVIDGSNLGFKYRGTFKKCHNK